MTKSCNEKLMFKRNHLNTKQKSIKKSSLDLTVNHLGTKTFVDQVGYVLSYFDIMLVQADDKIIAIVNIYCYLITKF